MAYLSDLMGNPITDADGERVGRLEDLIAAVRRDMPHPTVVALAVRRRGQNLLVPFSEVAALVAPVIPLTRCFKDVVPYQPSEHDLYLARDVLDKQIIDTNGVRVVRVNDLELARVNGHFYVSNVDVGELGLLRRLGLARSVQKIASRLGRKLSPGVIAWDDVELLPGNQPLRLRVAGEKMAELHPADLAELISHLNRSESGRFLETLDVKTLADTLEEVEPEFQASLVESMPDEKVADVLEEMAPDEAADLLAEIPEDRSRELLQLMERKEAEDVRKLLAYPVESAGGIMTTEYISVGLGLTAEQVLSTLRETAHEAETIAYVYVTDDDDHLKGAFSLQDLVLARPDTPVTEFMHPRVVSVNLADSQDGVAQAIAKYNLTAVPVVDDDKRLHGVVTADDALDKIIPTAWKKRLPRMYR
ncbi:MAG: magnesium transporter [Chloroflexi bacterium]|nr:magnesium transporter [Chloroflexota bacterium]MBI3760365.1 magnesium transporter [Chloroflexota bacterium]